MMLKRLSVLTIVIPVIAYIGVLGCNETTGTDDDNDGNPGTAGAGCWVTDMSSPNAYKVDLNTGEILVKVTYLN